MLEAMAEAAVEIGVDNETRQRIENLLSCKKCQRYTATVVQLRAQLAEVDKLLRAEDEMAAATGIKEKEPNLKPPQDKGQAAATVQAVISNSAILQRILANLDNKILLSLRLVSKQWEQAASNLLLTSGLEPMKHKWDRKRGYLKYGTPCVHLSYNPEENDVGRSGLGSISTLCELITQGKASGRKFPCTRFAITCPNLTNSQLTSFLSEHGHLIHSLTLHFISLPAKAKANGTSPPPPPPTYEELMESLQNFFFKWAVNLQYLNLSNGIPWPENRTVRLLDPNFPVESATIPNFKILDLQQRPWRHLETRESFSFRKDRTIIRDILSTAPNFEKVVGDACIFSGQLLLSPDKMGAVKSARFTLGHPDHAHQGHHIARLKFFARYCHQLEKITMDYAFRHPMNLQHAEYPDNWRPQVELLNQILENNKNSLKTLKTGQLGFFPGLDVPPMVALKNLKMQYDYYDSFSRLPGLTEFLYFRAFPQGLDLQKAFPNLSSFTMGPYESCMNHPIRERFTKEDRLPFLEADTPLTSVSKVDLFLYGLPDEPMRQMAALTPNVKVLVLSYDNSSPLMRLNARPRWEADKELQLPHIFRAIWKHFSGIEKLEVRCTLGSVGENKSIFVKNKISTVMDSCITGLDVETVTELRKSRGKSHHRKDEVADQVLEKRNGPSILDMKNLKYFRLGMNKVPMFSFVSATHGFNLMKNLQVFVEAVDGADRGSCLDDPEGVMMDRVQVINSNWYRIRYFSAEKD